MKQNMIKMRLIFGVFLVAVILYGAKYSFADPVRIEFRTGKGPWRSSYTIEALVGKKVSLRIKERSGDNIRFIFFGYPL